MAVVKNKSTEENREFWSHVEAVANEVRSWPDWMGNHSSEANVNCEPERYPDPKAEKP